MQKTPPKFIPLKQAREIAGRETDKAMTRFIERWNYSNLDHLILRIPGRVDENTLRAALNILAERHTPGMEVRRAVASKRSHINARGVHKQ